MKQIRLLLLSISILLGAAHVSAQTITIDSVSGTTFCAGDPIAVTFTASGTWGRTNAFTFQLSDQTGSFDSTFTYLGSIFDTLPGTFTIITSIPQSTHYSTSYRVRVIGAAPYVTAESGTSVTIGAHPIRYVWTNHLGAVAVGIPHYLHVTKLTNNQVGEADTVQLDFGEDATPRYAISLTQPNDQYLVTYATAGAKALISRSITKGGCSVSDTQLIYAYDCTSPAIPHNAIIVSSDSVLATYNKTYWVNPGVTFNSDFDDTVFAEAGANILGTPGSFSQTGNIVYLKPGATSNINYNGVVIHTPGAGVNKTDEPNAPTLQCSDLTFDYASAPPNSVMHINESAVSMQDIASDISLSPNPTTGSITIAGLPTHSQVAALDILGHMIEKLDASESCSIDLSKAPAGSYFIRISSAGRVVTKKVVKE